MLNSELISVLKGFSSWQLTRFGTWIHSKAHNTHEDIIRLYDYIHQFKPSFDDPRLGKNQAIQALSNGDPLTITEFDRLMNYLLRSIEDFLLYEDLQRDKLVRLIKLASIYRDMGLKTRFGRVLKKCKSQLQTYPWRNSHYYYLNYLLQNTETMDFSKKIERKEDEGMRSFTENFDLYFVSDKIKYFCEFENRKSILNQTYELELEQEVLNYIHNKRLDLNHPGIGIYYYIYKMLTSSDGRKYYELYFKGLSKWIHFFPDGEKKDLYDYGSNYWARQVNEGDQESLMGYINWNKFLIDENLLLENERLDPGRFKNIAIVGLRIGEREWVENFMDDYRKYLPKGSEGWVLFCEATVEYYEGKYRDVLLKLITMPKGPAFLLDLNCRLLGIKSTYELTGLAGEHYDIFQLDNACEALHKFIHRRKALPEDKIEQIHGFTRIIRKLARIPSGDKDKMLQLREKLDASSGVLEKAWLLAKIDQRIGKKVSPI